MTGFIRDVDGVERITFTRTELRALVREVVWEAQKIPNSPDRIADAVVDGVFPVLRIDEEGS